MDDDIASVDQHPIALAQSFHPRAIKSPGLDVLDQMTAHGSNLPGRGARGDNHVIGDGRFAGQRDANHIFSFVVIQRRFDDLQQVFRRACCRCFTFTRDDLLLLISSPFSPCEWRWRTWCPSLPIKMPTQVPADPPILPPVFGLPGLRQSGGRRCPTLREKNRWGDQRPQLAWI